MGARLPTAHLFYPARLCFAKRALFCPVRLISILVRILSYVAKGPLALRNLSVSGDSSRATPRDRAARDRTATRRGAGTPRRSRNRRNDEQRHRFRRGTAWRLSVGDTYGAV